ncbi:hypothetical protein ACFWBC_10450 [Streptomyces sp. NPDC059985]|uniref:hypothetical protein n=1 Tax=Streptomyces sp. NPDC059985 TaxID=3347025 RepID=UPI003676EC22
MGKPINIDGAPAAPGRPDNAVQLARALGASDKLPTKQLTDTPTLIAPEQDMLLKCESAIENLNLAFFAAGKALQVVRDAKLYRGQFGTFEEYTQERWEITPQYAGKLIRTWRVAEALHTAKPGGGLETIVSRKLRYGQAWELVPVVEEHGVQAAVYLYLALIKVKGATVTAAHVQGAVQALPREAAGHKARTEDAVLAYLGSLEEDGNPPAVAADAAKAVKALARAAKTFDATTIQAALAHDPERTRPALRSLIESLAAAGGVAVSFTESPTAVEAAAGPPATEEAQTPAT